MSIEHNVITDPNIHEPKGASSASAGEVYIADGAGSGSWGSVSAASKIWGAMKIHDSSTSYTWTSKVWKDITNYTALVDTQGITVNGAAGTMTVSAAGYYKVMATVSLREVSSGSSVDNFVLTFSVNGTPQSADVWTIETINYLILDDTATLVLQGVKQLSANDVINLELIPEDTSGYNKEVKLIESMVVVERFA